MIKKSFYNLFSFLLSSCDYTPIYSSNNSDYFIEDISFDGDIEINNLINKKIKISKYKLK